MKTLLTILLLALTVISYGQQVKKKQHYSAVRSFYVDLNNDGKTDTIILSSSLPQRGNFNKLTIKLAGYTKQTFVAKDYWTDVDKWFLDSNRNSLNTKMLFLKKTATQTVILLFGEIDGAGYRGEFSIINIENDQIKMVFDDGNSHNSGIDIEHPVKLAALEPDGRLCFIYTEYGEFDEQLNNAMIGTYSPFFIYPVNDSCKLNKPLMKKYNEQHYVFAGYKYSENIRIRYPNNGGKPTIWKKRRVEQ